MGPEALVGSATAAPPPPPGLGIRLAEAPANRKDDPRALTTIVDNVTPGSSFSRRFEATNGTAQPSAVKLYVRAATIAGGNFAIDDRNPGELTEWATIGPSTATISPGGSTSAELKIAVPTSATQGEYYGAVVVEKPAPTTGTGARIASRAAVAIYLSVSAGGEPRSDFSVTTLTASRNSAGAPVVSAQVKNTGGRALSLSGDLRLSEGPGGLSAGPFPAKLGTVIGIGQSEPVQVTLDKALPAGPWLATLKLRSGRIQHTSEGRITFPAAGAAAPVPATTDGAGKDKLPVVAVASGLVVLLLVAVSLLLFLKRRSRPKDRRDEPIEVTAG